MGLLEDNVPDKYTCYICRDPPGEREQWDCFIKKTLGFHIKPPLLTLKIALEIFSTKWKNNLMVSPVISLSVPEILPEIIACFFIGFLFLYEVKVDVKRWKFSQQTRSYFWGSALVFFFDLTPPHALCWSLRSEAESALLVWPRVAEQRPHVWPLVPGGELLSPKRKEDHHHPPAAGRCAPPCGGPERTATEDERPPVSQSFQDGFSCTLSGDKI